MVKLKSTKDKINLGVLVPNGELRYFKKKGDILELSEEEAKSHSIVANVEGGLLEVVDSKSKETKSKETKTSKDSENKKAFSNTQE